MAIKVRQGGAWVTVAEKNGVSATYTLPLTGTNGSVGVGSAKWTLDASTGTDTSVTLNPGANINISAIDVTGNDRSFTLSATDTTYDYFLKDHGSSTGSGTGNDVKLRLSENGANPAVDKDIRLIAGTNISFSNSEADDTLTISASGGTQASPGGPDHAIQFNDDGSFGGTGNFTYNDSTGDVTFSGANSIIRWDSSQDAFEFDDGAKASFGTSSDLQIYHSSSNSYIDESVGNDLYIRGKDSGSSYSTTNKIWINAESSRASIIANANAAVELYNASASSHGKVLETNTRGIGVFNTNTSLGGELSIFEATGSSGNNYISLKSPNALGASYTLTLPPDHGDANEVLKTDGNGNLDWTTNGSGGSSTFIGLTDTPSSYSSQGGKLVAVKTDLTGTQKLEFIDKTTYAISCDDGDALTEEKIVLTGSNPSSTDEIVLAVAGTGLSIARDGDKITFTGSIGGTTYDLKGGGTNGSDFTNDRGSGKIILDPSTGNDDEVTITAGTNIKIDNTGVGGFTISAASGSSGSGPTYTLPLTGSSGSSGSATWTLTPSDTSTANSVKLNAGSNVSISSLDTTGPTYEFTIDVAAAGGLSLGTNLTDVFHLSTGGELSADDAEEDGLVYWDDSTSKLTHFGVGSGNAGKVLRVDSNGTSLEWGTVSSGSDTTYTLPVFGTANESSGIKLTPDGGTASAAQTVNITGSGGITVIGSGTGTSTDPYELTVNGSSAGTDTTYSIEAGVDPDDSNNVQIKLKDENEDTFDPITITKGSGVTFSSVTTEGFTISADTQTGTTYQLQGGGTDSSTFPGGTGTIKLNTGGATQNTVTVTAGNNIRIDNTGNSGFRIHADNSGSGSGITIKDEGSSLSTLATTLNFTGDGVTASGTGVEKTINIPAASGGITVADEGSDLTTLATKLNFTGGGVTASGTGATKTINIPSGGGINGITIQEEGSSLSTLATTLNFVGSTVTASGTGATKTITVSGSSGISGITIKDEGNTLTTAATTLNFTGSTVTATGTGVEKTINITSGGISGITVADEGSDLTTLATKLNFTGGGVTASGTGATKTINIPSGGISGITIKDEGTQLTTAATTLNFTGGGVTATGTGAEKTINIPSGGISGITIQEEGSSLTTAATTLNFVGSTVTASGTGATKTITVTGSATDTKYDLDAVSSTDGAKIRLVGDTASGNNPDEVELVGGTNVDVTRNAADKITIDFDNTDFALDKIIEGNTSVECIDSGSNGRIEFKIDGQTNADIKFAIKNNGEALLKRTGTTLEGGHLQFEDSQGTESFAIDVYGTTSGNSVWRIIDQASITNGTGTERFSVNRSGAFGIGHIGNRNFGSTGQVLTSQGNAAQPTWSTAGSGSGGAKFYGYLSGTSGGGAGSISGENADTGTSYNIHSHSGSFGSNDNWNDSYDGGIQINLMTGTGASNYPVVVSGYWSMSGTTENSFSHGTIGQMTSLHAYDITSTSFKLQGRMFVQFADDSEADVTRYPDRISFAGFKN